MPRRIWPATLMTALPAVLFAVTTPAVSVQQNRYLREHSLSRKLVRATEFVNVGHVSRPACEEVQPPQALATPEPLYTSAVSGRRIKLSFIIGTDGKVHSPLILESAGLAGDRHVLQTVRTWRYRPAMCNGVPTETEGKIEFSSR